MSQRSFAGTIPRLFFGASTGRTATMAFANALNSETDTTCLHEGKFRQEETSGEQVLSFLTLENRLAYETPNAAHEIVAAKRGNTLQIAEQRGDRFFGDVAYNNVPFVAALAKAFPDARFVFFFRQCLDFVRSAASEEGTDETPVGWPPKDKPLTNVERYIALGRLQPREGSDLARLWDSWSHRAPNIWLWSETNRLLLDQAAELPKNRFQKIYFEEFRSAPVATYETLRAFLDMPGDMQQATKDILLARPINMRREKPAPITVADLDSVERAVFEEYAQPINRRLYS
jgi:hypothetical protein